jgi:DeoR/GlpR family transcriptional regulator of sugar metabolism
MYFLLALTHDDLAEAIAVSRETVTRELAALDRAGVIRRSKGWLVVPKTSPLIGMLLDD